MFAWIISVAGVIVLTVLLDIILPDGQTNKYIKGIFSVFVVMAIALPLTGYLNGGIDVGKIFDFSTKEYAIDNNYIYTIYGDAYKKEEERLISFLEERDKLYKPEKADIVFNPAEKKNVLYINLFYKKTVIDGDSAHINISDEVKKLVAGRYNIKKEDIRILPWYY